jgi:hypothetical protein
MTEYVLNRIKITGKLNERTPGCVVKEIIRAHNICIVKDITNIEELLKDIKVIESYRCLTIREPLTTRDLRILATYINIDYNSWTKSALLSAYKHMHDFDYGKDLSTINLYYEQKTYDSIESFNACMLYKLCLKNNIETNWNMKPENMCFLLKQYRLSLSNLREQLTTCIENMNKSSIINLLNNVMELNKDKENINTIITSPKKTPIENEKIPPILNIDSSELQKSLNKHKNSAYILTQINPKTHYDAIVLAALLYNLNLTESSNPLSEYMKIKEVKDISFYKPVDLAFRKRYIVNPDWYNLSLHWEPMLSFIYEDSSLKKLCSYEGFTQEDFRAYGFDALLQISRISFNVFLGKNVYGTEEYSAINLEELKELHNYECITMGNVETKDLTTYTFDEIATHFRINKIFTNPMKQNEILEPRIIRKISLYANKLNHSSILEAIEIVEKWKSFSTEHTDKLRSIFKHSYQIVDIFYKIIDTGMYMRGWKITNDKYPLNETFTVPKGDIKPEDIAHKIETNVFDSINEIFDRLEKYKDEEKKVLNELPLMKMTINGGNISYIVSPDPDDGSSIFERLRIVLNGDKHKNMKSCIRLTSNILLVSAHYYLCSLGLPEPFNIRELDHIT